MTGTYVGTSVPRREDRALIRGRAEFVDDITRTGLLHARFVRSQIPHGRITGIDVSAAAGLDGVSAVFTAADLGLADLLPPVTNAQAQPLARPLLARDRVRFVGEPYALVVAEDPYIAEDAAGLIALDLEMMAVTVDPLTATDESAPLLHEDLGTNVLYENAMEFGDVDAAFTDAPVVLTRRIRSPRQTALPMEPRGILAEPTAHGVHVHSSTQVPHMLRDAIAHLLKLADDDVVVSVPSVGGGFGLKAHIYPEEIAVAAAARALGRPVKWIEDRSDNLTSSCHARDQVIDVRIAADADGRLRALDIDLVCDVGAYGVYAHGAGIEASATPGMIPGPYDLRIYRYRTRAIATNKCPAGAYRGVGLPVATLVHERVMDVIADAVGLDPATVRRRNFIAAAKMPYLSVTGHRYDSGDYGKALDTVLHAVNYDDFAAEQQRARRQGRLLGVGISCFVEYTAAGSAVFNKRGMMGLKGFDEVRAVIDDDGGVVLHTTLPASGQGVETSFAQFAADQLKVKIDDVTIAQVDTGDGLDGNGTFGSRSATAGGAAIIAGCQRLRQRLLDDASELLEVAVADLTIEDGVISVAGVPDSSVTFQDLVRRGAPGRYTVDERYDPPHTMYPYGAHACVVSVDPGTGRVDILRYVVADDNGVLVNPMIAAGQIRGAVAQGLAGALYESMVYGDDGQPLTTSLMDYLVPTASELPRLEINHVAVPVPESPSGTKGVGESGTLPPAAAVANAIGNALGVECNELPVLPSWAFEAARSRFRESAAEQAKERT